MNKLLSLMAPLGRVMLSSLFIIAGVGKITGYAGTAGYMEAIGVPGALLPLVILLEIGGGLAIAVGFQTRIVAFLLAGFSLFSGLIFHGDSSDPMQQILLMKNIAIAGAFLFLVATGAGSYAIDNRRKG